MNFERLEKNLCDNILEAQIKLGFDGRPVSLNYMSPSLSHLLGQNADIPKVLADFAESVRPRLGNLTFRPVSGGFCLTVPSEGTAYIHNNSDGNEFIRKFIETVRNHTSFEKVVEVFRSFSENVEVIPKDNEEFQYLIYFTDGIPDDYRYCIAVEEEIDGSSHITYHRFIKEDYEDLGF